MAYTRSIAACSCRRNALQCTPWAWIDVFNIEVWWVISESLVKKVHIGTHDKIIAHRTDHFVAVWTLIYEAIYVVGENC